MCHHKMFFITCDTLTLYLNLAANKKIITVFPRIVSAFEQPLKSLCTLFRFHYIREKLMWKLSIYEIFKIFPRKLFKETRYVFCTSAKVEYELKVAKKISKWKTIELDFTS